MFQRIHETAKVQGKSGHAFSFGPFLRKKLPCLISSNDLVNHVLSIGKYIVINAFIQCMVERNAQRLPWDLRLESPASDRGITEQF